MSDVEYGLATHIQVVKGNMEEELSGAKKNQILMENKLANFTSEIQLQNDEMNKKILNLQNDFEQLKTLGERNSESLQMSANSFSSLSSDSSLSNAAPGLCPINSCQNEAIAQNEVLFYMYGDVTKSLIIDGVLENRQEDLTEIILHSVNEIGVLLSPEDIDDVYRIGKPNPNRKWPRPVKLTLKDQTKRDQIFIFKARLRFSETFKGLRISKEERKDVRVRAAKLRQAGLSATKLGHKVEARRPGEIRIDGIIYNTLTLKEIPLKFMHEANEIRDPPQNSRRLSLFERCRTRAKNVIMVGHSLQKTPHGLAFYSIKSFLSNFYRCDIYFRGQNYTSLEQGYQCTKAEICQDRMAYNDIYKADSPAEMKRLGRKIQVNDNWGKYKLQVMEDLIYAKFKQNKELYYSLLNTRPLNLIEATLDDFWGAGCVLGSIALEEGSWVGQNHLGKLLEKVRAHFVRELEEGQGGIR